MRIYFVTRSGQDKDHGGSAAGKAGIMEGLADGILPVGSEFDLDRIVGRKAIAT